MHPNPASDLVYIEIPFDGRHDFIILDQTWRIVGRQNALFNKEKVPKAIAGLESGINLAQLANDDPIGSHY